MASLTKNTSASLGQVLAAIGAAGNTLTKIMFTFDRLTDAGYSHADTFAINTELRNKGAIEDTILEEEKNDLERILERKKFEEQLNQFQVKRTSSTTQSKSKPSKAKPSRTTKAKA